MVKRDYEADVAITSEGQILAKFHEQLLVFDNLSGLDNFIDEIKAKRDMCASKVMPLDDRLAKKTSEEVIEWLEGEAKKLSSPKESTPKNEVGPRAKKGDTSTMIMDALVKFFQEDDWKAVSVVQVEESLRAQVAGDNGTWQFYAYAREKTECALFYSVCPVFAPESKRAQAAEYITRANQGLRLGNFEMDYDDGEIRYKTSIDVEGHELVSPLIKQLVSSNISMMDRYLPGIMKVIYTDTSPEKEIKEIEAG
jgi:hypothetical protein